MTGATQAEIPPGLWLLSDALARKKCDYYDLKHGSGMGAEGSAGTADGEAFGAGPGEQVGGVGREDRQGVVDDRGGGMGVVRQGPAFSSHCSSGTVGHGASRH